MDDTQLLHLNAEKWAAFHPKEALRLPYCEDSTLEFCHTKRGELNLCKRVGDKREYYHVNTDAAREAKQWFQKLDLDGKEVVYIFGIGLGYYYDVLEPWLRADERRAAVFLECDLGVIHRFFQTERATRFLDDPQAYLYCFDDLHRDQDTFNALYWNFIHTQMAVSALRSYARSKKELTSDLHHKIVYEAALKNSLVEEYLRYGANFFKNFYINLLYLADSAAGVQMFDQFHQVPAIICGAGPSLLKQMPLLEEICQQGRAVVFAGGSALNAFSNAGVLPHLGAGIDPNPTQLLRLATNSAFELPFFYRNRLLPPAFRKIHGPRLYIPGAGGYDVADWFEKELDIHSEEELSEGHNIVNFCVEIATRMGCNPIIFVGMDLGFTGMRTYAAGIEKNVHITKKELTHTGDFSNDGVLRRDIYGKPFYTLWKWIAEGDWIGEYAQDHPNTTFLNCTEGGLGIPTLPNVTFRDAVAEHLNHSYDLNNYIHAAIEECSFPPTVTHERIVALIREMEASVTRCKEHFTVLLEETEKTIARIESEGRLPSILQSGLAALSETELSEEIAYTWILELFNHIYTRVMSVHLRHIRLSHGDDEVAQTLARQHLNLRRLTFLRDVCRVNLGLIGLAFRSYELGDMPLTEAMRDELQRLVPT